MGDDLDVRGLNLIRPGEPENPRVARIRTQLKAADAWVTEERAVAEPDTVRQLRQRGEQLLGERLYEDAEEAFLDAIDAGLAEDHFCWQAAVNIVNCQLFLRRLDDADATAAQLLEMYAEQPELPLHYLVATQRGAIAAERWGLHHQSSDATTALHWARVSYDWQEHHRVQADGLRAYNLVVALLRLKQVAEAKAMDASHSWDDDYQSWCRQGEHAAEIADLRRESPD